MPTYTSKKLRFHNATQFKESFTETDASVGYVFLSRHQYWPNESSPSSISDTAFTEKEIWDHMIAAKKVTASDIELVVSKEEWAANVRYRQYDDLITLEDLLTNNVAQNLYSMYVINSENNIYKCISNNANSTSTTEPTGQNLSYQGIIQTSDGYLWKYLYNIENTNKFISTNWIPVPISYLDLEYGGSANATVDGEVTTIVVTNSGNNYYDSNIIVGAFSSSCTTLTVDASIAIANIVKPNMSISGNGITGGSYITAVDSFNRKINLSYATTGSGGGASNNILVSTRVVVQGDGTGISAVPTISSNSVQKITLTGYGQNYKYANAIIYGTATGSNVANARVIIAPKYGHGYSPGKELGGHNLTLVIKFGEADSTEGNVISTNTSFRQYGLIIDPHKYGENTAITFGNSNTVISQTTDLSLIAGDSYQVQEYVYQGSLSNPTFSGYIESFVGNVLSLTNTRGTITLGTVLKGSNTNPTGRTVSDISYPGLEKYTGDVLYGENIIPITRADGQAETIKFVVKF